MHMDENPCDNAQEQEAIALEAEIQALRRQLRALESQYSKNTTQVKGAGVSLLHSGSGSGSAWDVSGHGLTKEQVERYSRQIILPSFGVSSM